MTDEPRQALTQQRIVAMAIELIDEAGLEGFSLPKLAATLGVRTSALYRHFTDREALLAAVARAVTAGDDPPEALPPGQPWTEYFVQQSSQLRRRIVAHPPCAPLIVQFMPKDGVFEHYDLLCGYLETVGVPARFHVRIVDALTALTIGAAVLAESAADYTPGGRGPTPDARTRPALTRALAAIGDSSAEELFAGFVRTYLQAIVEEMAADVED